MLKNPFKFFLPQIYAYVERNAIFSKYLEDSKKINMEKTLNLYSIWDYKNICLKFLFLNKKCIM